MTADLEGAMSGTRRARREDAPRGPVGPGGPGGPGGRRPRGRGRRVAKVTGIVLAVLVLITAGAGAWLYNKLSGNINSVSLGSDSASKLGSEKPDAFGRTPIDMVVLGTDARNTQEDCNLGGDCNIGGGYGNADVEMVVHISADRSNATVMSIPRDTMVHVPACTDPKDPKNTTQGYYGMVNSALGYGPLCQMQTIHQLTGIPLSHFMMVSFSGVVSMSDAVGGVQVCVDNNVYDTYSHLKLAKGDHTLKGVAALEFVRSRHAFGDGSDLGRTYAQHMFLSSLMRKMKSAGTLTDPGALYNLANSATKALTVDSSLGSVGSLLGLAADVAKVPTSRITFTTMQTAPDPSNPDRVVPATSAQALFAAIANDQPLSEGAAGTTKPSAAPSTAAPAQPGVPAADVSVHVENGSGVTGRAGELAAALTRKGFGSGTSASNAPTQTATTTLRYPAGDQAKAQTVASALGIPAAHLSESSAVSRVTLVIGSDWTSGVTYPGGGGKPAPVSTHAALSDSHAETADQGNTCAPVSTFRTVELNGVSMTPSQAYARATDVPDSAP
ncbi:LCP family protein required for cell wall assembly [Streptacidiphilus sp. MAP12-33]|uniref:LCP family protein n=1 Tax=Streptacidiphilus sp. MAP12-33 TaxID=3156266 RepID=UPI00351903F2